MFGVYKLKRKLLPFLLSFALIVAIVPTSAVLASESGSAQIGDISYASLQEAFNAVPEDGVQTTVTLTNSIEISEMSDIVTLAAGKNVILNMNGQSITFKEDSSASPSLAGRAIINHGTLTVTGNGTIDTSASIYGGYGAIDNYGTLTIENGTYTGAKLANGATIKNRPNAELTIYNGTFDGATCSLYNEGITTIYNGTFKGETCSSCNSSIWSYTIRNQNVNAKMYFYDGTVIGTQGAFSSSAGLAEIYGGTFETVACPIHGTGPAFYALYIAGEVGQVEAHIYGGTFTSVSKVAALIGNDNDGGDKQPAIAYFHGGTFTGGNGQPAVSEATNTGTLQVTGGTYSSDVSKWVPDTGDYEQNPDGSITHPHQFTEEIVKEYTKKSDADCTHAATYYKSCTCGAVSDTATFTYGDPLGHTEKIIPAVSPTCTEHGYTEGIECSVCHEILTAPTEVPATGHSYGDWTIIKEATCTEEGLKQRTCTVCSTMEEEIIPMTEHDWENDFTIDQQPTATENGSKSIHCKNCEAVKDVTVINSTADSNNMEQNNTVSPQTGDNPQLYIYIAIGVFVSAACAAAIAFKKIKTDK